MHGDTILAGPVWWFAVVLLLLAWVLAGFTAFDSLRSAREERFAVLPESRWLYFVPQVSFFVVAAITQVAAVSALAVAVIAAAPIALVLGVVYLLRVAFPKQPLGQ